MNALAGFREHAGVTLILASLVVVTTFALAACGGSGTPSSKSTSATPTASTSASSTVSTSPPPTVSTSAPPAASRLNLPTDEVVAALEGRIAAWMRKDFQAAASYYAEDGALIEMDGGDANGVVSVGREDLTTALGDMYRGGLRLKSAGLPLQYDGYVAAPTRIHWPNVGPDDAYMLVYKLDADNKFARQWVFIGGHAPSIAASPTPTPVAQLTSRPNVPSRSVMSLLEGRMAATNRGDGEAAAYYAEDGFMIEMGGLYGRVATQGPAKIAVRLRALFDQGVRLEPAGLPIQYSRLVAEPVRFTNVDGRETGVGMLVFDIDAHHKIAWQWVIAPPWLPDE